MGKTFYAGGFFYDPKTKAVFLHLRDGNTAVNPHKWGFFGGTSEGDETPRQCFIRELKEETGYVASESEVKEVRNYFNTERQTQRHVFYIEKYVSKETLVLGEGAGFDWLPLDELGKYDLTEKTINDIGYFKKHVLTK
jgi:8-oxo-dGTP pyrophosphatase MutT (NUDIX family)